MNISSVISAAETLFPAEEYIPERLNMIAAAAGRASIFFIILAFLSGMR
jgi:hypothetical protein